MERFSCWAGQSVLLRPVCEEIEPGEVLAAPWPEMPTGDGPFGLAPSLRFLECYCVNRELTLAPVQLPLIIHSSDLRKIAPRWAELTAIIRSPRPRTHHGKLELCRPPRILARSRGVPTEARTPRATNRHRRRARDAPVIDYTRPIESARGEIVWDEQIYQSWREVAPGACASRAPVESSSRCSTRWRPAVQSGADLEA